MNFKSDYPDRIAAIQEEAIRALFEHAKEEVRAAVLRGVALLDAEMPRWHTHVNLDNLDMSNDAYSVLGQVWGCGDASFVCGMRYLKLSPEGVRYHGFRLSQKDWEYPGFQLHPNHIITLKGILCDTWVQVITPRLFGTGEA